MKKFIARLNGWQRLFVVIATVWIIPIYLAGYKLTHIESWGYIYSVLSEEEKKSIDFSKLTPEQIRVAEGVLSEAEKNGVDANYFLISAYKKNHFSQPLPPYPSREQTAAERILWERENFNNMPNGVTAVTFADGERLSITTFRYTQDELITAYQRAKPEIDTVKREALSEYALTIARAYFLPLFALYFSGWSIAWIRKGFNNARQDK